MKYFNMFKNMCRRYRRYLSSFFMQDFYSPIADRTPLLRKKLVLVTGGSDGLGFEAALKMVLLGATVVVASDNLYKADRAAQAIRALLNLGREKIDLVLTNMACTGPEGILDVIKRYGLKRPMMLVDQDEDIYGEVHSIYLNLADLKAVADCVKALNTSFKGKTWDHIVLAGSIMPEDNVFSLQGHEIAFATNVLGHFALVALFIDYHMVRIESQVLVVGCEDYFVADDCTTDFTFPEEEYGYQVYRRSKLGQFWFTQELQRRYSYLSVCIVHPGYLNTRLGMDSLYISRHFIGFVALSPRVAADVLVICVQHSNTLPKAVYYHNTCGQMILDSREIALSEEKAKEFWELMEGMLSEYMRMRGETDEGLSEKLSYNSAHACRNNPRCVSVN